ncbi:MAG: exodeoxyribonuclease VII large subunit [Candidatus Dasytiphilus stammeri]
MSHKYLQTVFTVSRLNKTVRELIEKNLKIIWLNAEVSNFSQPTSGHWYFTLKDNTAQVRCVMFRNCNRRAMFCPKNGQQILVQAAITLYESRGDYQLIAENIQPAGDGILKQQYEQLKNLLFTEGLFNHQFKQRLPNPAQKVGIITSTTGAALHDILRILHRRDPLLPIIIYPAIVQGELAPESLKYAIEIANKRKECDVLIIGRGGGSWEDLWCFNDERVARAIFASQIPTISAVGHETDVTIADFVADVRAPTPSVAAELVSRNKNELLRQIQSQKQRLAMAMDYFLAQQHNSLTSLFHQLKQHHPQLSIMRQRALLTAKYYKLEDLLQMRLRNATQQYTLLEQRLLAIQPQLNIYGLHKKLQQLQYRIHKSISILFNKYRQHLVSNVAQLETLSPLATLIRGYSITKIDNTLNQRTLIKSINQVQLGNILKTRFIDGEIISKVLDIKSLKSK